MISNVLVTGGSRGIGRAVCVRLASEGRHIIINYVSNEAAARETLSLVEAAGGTGELLRFDVGDIAETSAALKSWQEAHPDEYIDVLVNNAGIRRDNLLLWMEPEEVMPSVSGPSATVKVGVAASSASSPLNANSAASPARSSPAPIQMSFFFCVMSFLRYVVCPPPALLPRAVRADLEDAHRAAE